MNRPVIAIAIAIAAFLIPMTTLDLRVTATETDDFEITADVQQFLDAWKKNVQKWANGEVFVEACRKQNEQGPIDGMTEDKWKKARDRDPIIIAMQTCPAAKLLEKMQKGSKGAVTEMFLAAAKSETIAFLEKPATYIHHGEKVFDAPFDSHESWQGMPRFDESAGIYWIQISVPVMVKVEPEDEKPSKAIGALVVGLSLEGLSAPSGK